MLCFSPQYRQTGTKCLVLLFSLRLENLSNCWSQKSSIHWQFTTPLSWFFYYYDSTFLLLILCLSISFSFSFFPLPSIHRLSAVSSTRLAHTSSQSPLRRVSLSLYRTNMCLFSPHLRRILSPVGWPFAVFFSSLRLIIVIIEIVVFVVASFFLVFLLPILALLGFSFHHTLFNSNKFQ